MTIANHEQFTGLTICAWTTNGTTHRKIYEGEVENDRYYGRHVSHHFGHIMSDGIYENPDMDSFEVYAVLSGEYGNTQQTLVASAFKDGNKWTITFYHSGDLMELFDEPDCYDWNETLSHTPFSVGSEIMYRNRHGIAYTGKVAMSNLGYQDNVRDEILDLTKIDEVKK